MGCGIYIRSTVCLLHLVFVHVQSSPAVTQTATAESVPLLVPLFVYFENIILQPLKCVTKAS